MSLRSHMPWPWRLLILSIIAALAIAFGGRIYDELRRITGWGGGATPQEAAQLRDRIAQLENENKSLMLATTTGNLVDRSTTQELLTKISGLQGENTRLKEDIAVFEHLGKGESVKEPLAITNFKVTPDAEGGRYRYEFFVAQRSDRRSTPFTGHLQILIHLKPRNGGEGANILMLPRQDDPDAASYSLSFKFFEKVSGVFELPSGDVPRSVEVRLLQGKTLRAAKSVNI